MSYLAPSGIGALATAPALSTHLSGRWRRDWKNAFPLHVKSGEEPEKSTANRERRGKREARKSISNWAAATATGLRTGAEDEGPRSDLTTKYNPNAMRKSHSNLAQAWRLILLLTE